MKPILFNTEMVRAILEGRKTVIRRCVKFLPGQNPNWTGYVPDGAVLYGSNNIPAAKAPYRTGDVLYVWETWSKAYGRFMYRAWTGTGMDPEKQDEAMRKMGLYWYPSIHMPKEAARLFLRVKSVRAERLRDVDYAGAISEGVPENSPAPVTQIGNLWESTIKPSDMGTYGWEANPWVWVISFERISKEEAFK